MKVGVVILTFLSIGFTVTAETENENDFIQSIPLGYAIENRLINGFPRDVDPREMSSMDNFINFGSSVNSSTAKRKLKQKITSNNAKSEEDTMIDGIMRVVENFPLYYLPAENLIPGHESQCLNDIRAFNVQYRLLYNPGENQPDSWILLLMDSWGKFNDGFFFGNVHVTGMFEQCLQFDFEVDKSVSILPSQKYNATEIQGKYCTIRYLRSNNSAENDTSNFDRSGPSLASLTKSTPFSYSTCMPASCSRETLEKSLNATLEAIGRTLDSVVCQDRIQGIDLDAADIGVLSVVGFLIILLVAATTAHLVAMGLEKDIFERDPQSIVLYFSFCKNLAEIFQYDKPDCRGKTFHCLHSIRVITVVWIIVCHQYEFGINFSSNTVDSVKYQDPAFAQAITNGWVSVDSFFFMTGLLIGFKLVPELKDTTAKKQARVFGIFILRRIIRFLPSILLLAGIAATFFRHLGQGPLAPDLETYSRGLCAKHWWKDVLFINNFISWGDNLQHPVEDCLDHTWYTAVDMQLTLILPLFILPLFYNRIAGLAWLGFVSLMSVAIPLAMVIVYDLPPAPLMELSLLDQETYDSFMRLVYFPPWCRAAPWLVGLWGGMLMSEGVMVDVKFKKIFISLGFVAAIAVGMAVTFGLYPYNVLPPTRPHYSGAVAALYLPFGRLAWGLSLLFVVYSCYSGNAYLPNKIMSYPGWQPLSRLSFSIYLLAPLVQRWWAAALFLPVYYSYLSKLFESCGVFFISFVFAVLLSAAVERPFKSLADHFLLPSRRKSQQLFESCGVFFISFVFAVLLSAAVERPCKNLADHFLLSSRRKSQQERMNTERSQELQRLATIYRSV